ncbi:plasmid rolling circle replication initiator protein [Streptococcus pneumoniae]|nr:plasmid rolling circle replication initiator protein [Streptococcus pneumoniae]
MKYSYQTSQIVDEAIKEQPKGRFPFLDFDCGKLFQVKN